HDIGIPLDFVAFDDVGRINCTDSGNDFLVANTPAAFAVNLIERDFRFRSERRKELNCNRDQRKPQMALPVGSARRCHLSLPFPPTGTATKRAWFRTGILPVPPGFVNLFAGGKHAGRQGQPDPDLTFKWTVRRLFLTFVCRTRVGYMVEG